VEVRLAYGDAGLVVDLPEDRTTAISPRYVPAPEDQVSLLRSALEEPVAGPRLAELVAPGQTVAISVCDITRPQPRKLVVPLLLDELEQSVDLDDVVILVATGTHRPNDDEELEAMLGPSVLGRARVVSHDARDEQQLAWCGVLGHGVSVWLNRRWVEADVRVTTGFVEPHFFAGFSGGPKMVAPGLAGLETILTLHDAARIGHPQATWGTTHGNPIHDDIRAIATATGVTFDIDVLLNREQDVIAAFSGELFAAHAAACAAARDLAMVPVPERFPVVVTSNAGYPLDQNLYQCVKGMSAAAQVVRPGGLIVCAAECRDGFPDHGEYRALLESEPTPEALLAAIDRRTGTVPDQWQVQIQAGIQRLADVTMHTTYLSDADLERVHLRQTPDIEDTVTEALTAYGGDARVCVLPEGPLSIPYVRAR
jgi:nickel-dependent lactate racemase